MPETDVATVYRRKMLKSSKSSNGIPAAPEYFRAEYGMITCFCAEAV